MKTVRENDITAVFAVNEQLAWNMILHASRTGVKIPEDISIAAIGDEDRAEVRTMGFDHFVYALHPWEEIGCVCGEKMLKRLNGDSSPAELVSIPPLCQEIDTVKRVK